MTIRMRTRQLPACSHAMRNPDIAAAFTGLKGARVPAAGYFRKIARLCFKARP